jgi:hypothetical protein
LNLRRNPFGEPSGHQRAQLAVVDVEDSVVLLEQEGHFLELVGRRGRGKSTHLYALQAELDRAALLRAPRPSERMGAMNLPDARVLLVDDAQFLTPAERKKLFESAESVAVATHETLSTNAEHAGFTHHVQVIEGLDTGRLRTIFDKRIAWARRGSGEVPGITDDALEALIDRHGDDLRSIEDVLYSIFQSLEHIRAVDASDVADARTLTFTSSME